MALGQVQLDQTVQTASISLDVTLACGFSSVRLFSHTFIFIGVLLYNLILVSAVQQDEWAIHMHVSSFLDFLSIRSYSAFSKL